MLPRGRIGYYCDCKRPNEWTFWRKSSRSRNLKKTIIHTHRAGTPEHRESNGADRPRGKKKIPAITKIQKVSVVLQFFVCWISKQSTYIVDVLQTIRKNYFTNKSEQYYKKKRKIICVSEIIFFGKNVLHAYSTPECSKIVPAPLSRGKSP